MAAESKASARKALARQRREQALELRIQGASYRAIAKALGVTPKAAYDAVSKALDELNERCTEKAAQLRQIEASRLDRISLQLFKRAVKDGDLQAIDRYLKIMERRAKLFGLDKPFKAEIDVNGDFVVEWGKAEEEGEE